MTTTTEFQLVDINKLSLDRFQYKGYSDQYHVYRQYASAKGIHYRPDYQTPKEE